MAHAIWNYQRKIARTLSASDVVDTIYFFDMEEVSIDYWIVITTKPSESKHFKAAPADAKMGT